MLIKTITLAANAIIIALTFYLLFIGRHFLLPFVTAIVIWYVILLLAKSIQSVRIIKLNIPWGVAVLLAIGITCALLYKLFLLIGTSAYSIAGDAGLYQAKLLQAMDIINAKLHLNLDARSLLAQINLTSVFTNLALAITNILQNLLLIIIYVLFLLLETNSFHPKLKAMFNDHNAYLKTRRLLDKIQQDIGHYIKIKTLVSFMVAASSYVVLISFDVKDAGFWSALIFLLNYIPTIGSIIAVLMILLIASVQFASIALFALMAGILISIQMVFGNIVEPKMTGRMLNLSPIIVLLSLAIWGSVWGVLGMFLCVPLMTTLNIILAQFDSTRPIAVWLTADGVLPEKNKF